MSLLSEHTYLNDNYKTEESLFIERSTEKLDPEQATIGLAEALDQFKGALFSSSFEYTGRYTRWDTGFINPPIELRLKGRHFTIRSLNDRGKVILNFIKGHLPAIVPTVDFSVSESLLSGTLPVPDPVDDESERTRQPSVFDILRGFKSLFHMPEDRFLGLYGAFGYDLIFQLEPIEQHISRQDDQSDLVLYMPDEIVAVDRKLEMAYRISYDFSFGKETTQGKIKKTLPVNTGQPEQTEQVAPYQQGHFGSLVETAMPAFHNGELYEVVPSQVLKRQCKDKPSAVFQRLKKINPSPYGFLLNLGDEHLVGASPEMFVRVEGSRVETCPISGTIKRGSDALEDAEQIRALLDSEKDEIELTMCTDVDRNDKSRICKPGSVHVIGRRQIEAYSHLFHTVDHIEGTLRPEYDALDAFMTHMWAVTVTGSPKPEAVKWIESHETSARGWYGGAVGFYTFDGRLNTGLTLRTARMKNGIGEVRVGATVLHASDPAAEEEETLVKARALLKVLEDSSEKTKVDECSTAVISEAPSKRILLVDHEDSFVHTLANYLRQTRAEVIVSRPDAARRRLKAGESFELVVLSPGPGRPERFQMNETITLARAAGLPIFGVCLGFQGLAEYYGGTLGKLSQPCHGEASALEVADHGVLFKNIKGAMEVGRYHSLYIHNQPAGFVAEAECAGILMAARHADLPIAGVQFHPESILSLKNEHGLQLIQNAVNYLVNKQESLSLQ